MLSLSQYDNLIIRTWKTTLKMIDICTVYVWKHSERIAAKVCIDIESLATNPFATH